jgi:hypothetical protein
MHGNTMMFPDQPDGGLWRKNTPMQEKKVRNKG